MKKNFKYLLVGMFITLISPIVTNAAGITLKEKNNEKNIAIYDVIYDPINATENSVNIKVNKINDGLKYSLDIANGVINQKNDDLSYTINVQEIAESTTIASITIINELAEKKEDIILSVIGTYSATTEPFTIAKNPEAIEIPDTSSTTTTTTTTQRVLSSEAVLSGINLSVGSMDQTFSADIMEYNVTGIKDTVNSVTITPNCENNCTWSITCPTGGCSISNTRRVTLQNGANKVAINVTSEDGSANKTYILNMYKGEVVASSAYLSELKINDGTISPNFDSMVNDYTITVGMDVEKLDIITTTEDPSAEVQIKGNDKLVEGENTITITVTSSDGENKQVYTIIVTKEEIEKLSDEEEQKEIVTTPVKKKNNNTWLIILLSVLGLGLIIVLFLIIFKKKKNKKKNDNNNNKPSGPKKEEIVINKVELENTESLNILNETNKIMDEEPKQDIDEALDDLMQTKRLELGDLNFY